MSNNVLFIKKISFFLVLFFIVINYFQPLIVDDLCRGAIAALYNHSIIEHIIGDYYHWTGRVTAELLAYFFFNHPYQYILSFCFNILNSLILVIFLNNVFEITTKTKTEKITLKTYLFFIAFFLYYLIITDFLKNAIWKTVGLQYFWGICLLSLLYKDQFVVPKPKLKNPFILFLCGLFIGLYHEIFFACITLLIAFYLLYNFAKKMAFNTQVITFVLGNIIGGIILVIAPGNYERQKSITPHYISWQEKFSMLINSILSHHLLVVVIFLAIFCTLFDRSKDGLAKLLQSISLALIIFIFLPVANYELNDRMLMLHYIIYSIVILQYVLANSKLWFQFEKILPTHLAFISVLGILGIIFIAYYYLFSFNNIRGQSIRSYQEQHLSKAIFPRYEAHAFYKNLVYFDDIVVDSSNWKNKCFAEYYNFKEVRLSKDNI